MSFRINIPLLRCQSLFTGILAIIGILLCCSLADAQTPKGTPSHDRRSRTFNKNNAVTNFDTFAFHLLNVRFSKEYLKGGYLNLDSLKYYGNMAIHEAESISYDEGLIQIYLGFGSAFVDKYTIDSAKYYYKLAQYKSVAINDSNLLAKAYLGYAWTLIYDNSDYAGAVKNALSAHALAKETGDTSLLMSIYTKLIRIYFLKTDLLKAYESCLEYTVLCKSRRDTSALIYNYNLFGSIFSIMNLHDKQMDMVYQSLRLANHVSDSVSMYTINSTAANGYLGKEQYDSVLYYSRLNLPLCRKMNKYVSCLANIAKAHLETNQLDSAQYYYKMMLQEQKSNGMYINVYQYLDLGTIEYRKGNQRKALEYYKTAEAQISKPPLTTQRDIYKALYEYYAAANEHEDAFRYLEKHKIMSDSILITQNTFKTGISFMETESTLLESQVQLLTKDMELQASIAAKKKQQEIVMFGSTALILLLSGLAFVRYEKQKNEKAKQALLDERLRISRELHDEVGSTLSGIAMYSHVAKEQVKNAEKENAENSLTIMQKSAGEMVNKLSDIVWLINPELDTIEELFARLEEYARQMAYTRNMDVHIEYPEAMSKHHIPLEARRNIYLFCKESINNAVKYSKGSIINLQVIAKPDHFRFSVSDDGVGFDVITVKRGNGLNNMRRRAEDIGATFHIESRPNGGSKVALQYKLTQ